VTTWTRVARRAADAQPLTVGIVGAGYVGRGLLHLLDRLPGFRPAVVVNRTVERGVTAFVEAGARADDVVVATDERAARDAFDQGRPLVTPDPELAIALDGVDALVEATGTLDHGAGVMLTALEAGRRVVSINAEVDAAIGWLLHGVAARHGGVYTICDGDQPGVLMRTIDRVQHWRSTSSPRSTASATSTCTSLSPTARPTRSGTTPASRSRCRPATARR
jgi:predicted homoserine dehydrogenase-like protein